jgi:hypothetical protein
MKKFLPLVLLVLIFFLIYSPITAQEEDVLFETIPGGRTELDSCRE